MTQAQKPLLDEMLSRLRDLPTLPTTVTRTMQLMEDPFCAVSELAQVIQSDPAMAARVLRMTNSAFYGLRQRVGSVQQAVTLLGFSVTKDVLLTAAVFDTFGVEASGLDLKALWCHSVATATAARALARYARYPHVEQAYTAGLLHDLGKIVIAHVVPRAVQAIHATIREEGVSMYEAERRILGISHAAIGAWALKQWGLPKTIVDAVDRHHSPRRPGEEFALASLVCLANCAAYGAGLGGSIESVRREAEAEVLADCGLTAPLLRGVEEMLLCRHLDIQSHVALAA